MYYEDRLKGGGFTRVILRGAARPARQAATSSSCAAASRSGCGRRSRPSIRATAAALTDRIGAAPALLDTLTPLVGLLLRDARRRGVIRTNLSTRPFYNERAVRVVAAVLARRRRSRRRRSTSSRVLRYSRSDTAAGDAGVARRGARRRTARQAAQLRASVDPRQVDSRRPTRAQANDLIDRRTFSWTELFNRFETTLPDDVRIAAVRPTRRPRARHRARRSASSRAASTTSTSSWRTSRRPARSANVRPAEEHTDEDGQLDVERSRRSTCRPAPAKPRGAPTRGSDGDDAAWKRILREKRGADRAAGARARSRNVARLRAVGLSARREVGRRRRSRRRRGAVAAGRRARARRRARRWSPASRAPIRSSTTFYDKVLPAEPARGARLTYATPAGARAKTVERHDCWIAGSRSRSRRRTRVSACSRSTPRWQCDYESFRQFIYALESAPRVRDHRRRDARAGRSDEAADAHHRAVDLLPPGRQWQLSASRQLVLAALVVVLIVVAGEDVAGPAVRHVRRGAAASNRAGDSGGAPRRSRVQRRRTHRRAPRGARRGAAEAGIGRTATCSGSSRRRRRPPPPAQVRPAAPAPPPAPTGPPPPPPLPPIPLKFIGVDRAPEQRQKIAILSDGRNPPFLGQEGAIIEGRYRILRIGVESIEMAYLDGRGRQTIRLTGS